MTKRQLTLSCVICHECGAAMLFEWDARDWMDDAVDAALPHSSSIARYPLRCPNGPHGDNRRIRPARALQTILPPGWSVAERVSRNGRPYRVYMDADGVQYNNAAAVRKKLTL